MVYIFSKAFYKPVYKHNLDTEMDTSFCEYFQSTSALSIYMIIDG